MELREDFHFQSSEKETGLLSTVQSMHDDDLLILIIRTKCLIWRKPQQMCDGIYGRSQRVTAVAYNLESPAQVETSKESF